MFNEKLNSKELYFFVAEMLSSIRDLNRRMDELSIIFHLSSCGEELKKQIENRFKRLQETKFCLIYSFYDIRNDLCDIMGEDRYKETLGTIKLYEELKKI